MLGQAGGSTCRGSASPAPFAPPAAHRRRCAFRSRRATLLQRPRAAPAELAASPSAGVDVVVVGAGVAGLRCSKLLSARGLSVALLEASDAPGGRVRTDATDDGFLLDRGFQIFLTSYPEAKAALDYDALRLRPFYAGADVRTPVDGRYHRLADPFRHPVDALRSLLPGHGVGTLLDKVRVGLLRLASLTGGPYAYVRAPERTIDEALASWGFTPAFVDSFFRPFLGGIFFDAGLSTTDRLLTFVMRCLATGQNCLPERGIGAVSEQLAAGLPPGCLRLRSRVERIAPRGGNGLITVTLEPRGSSGGHESGEEGGASWGGGGVISARAVVLAVEGPEAVRLSNGRLESHGGATSGAAVGTTCVYFAAPAMRNTEPMLLLNGDGRRGPTAGLVNNACVPSAVSPSYAPPGQALVSASILGVPTGVLAPDGPDGGSALADAVRAELSAWFPTEDTRSWRHLRSYAIPFAQPGQSPPTDLEKSVRLGDGMYVCGDHREAATLDGALRSGRRAAEAVIQDVGWQRR